MSSKWAKFYCRMLRINSRYATLSSSECTSKSATSKYGMHLQKCNLKIWNYTPERAPSIEENGSIIPMWTKIADAEVSWLRGSVNSGIVYVPDSHPTPFRFFWGLFLVYFWSVFLRPRWRRCSCLLYALHCNACITSDGRRWTIHPPPPIG